MTNASPPFQPPYKTYSQTPEGQCILETLADGTSRRVAASEPTAKAPAQPRPHGNERAVMFLEVPFAEKDNAKRLGAKWDKDMRKWYIPHGLDIKLFKRWWPEALKQEANASGQK
jgi:hypothetical protein